MENTLQKKRSAETDLGIFMSQCASDVDRVLEDLIPREDVEPVNLHSAIRWSLFAGGKRMRPAILMAVGQVFDVPREKLLRTSAAIEMIHTYSLIHDDLPAMDNDELRRGRQTSHVKFGEATAILAGDTLQNLAFLTIANDANLTADLRIRLIAEIASASGTPRGMVAGQQMDLEAEGDRNITIKDLEAIHRYKTGAMINVSARSGAFIAGAGDEEITVVGKYAEHLGLLFQITDDILDVTMPTSVLGKTAGKDISAVKATYPALLGLEKARELAEIARRSACVELSALDRDCSLLNEIADFIHSRSF